MKDLKIVNARIPEFEMGTWREADLLIHGGIIEKIGSVREETGETIDAAGAVVSPGFIDIHAHEDPVDAGDYAFFTARCELRMGVTTMAAGNCGDNSDAIELFCKNLETQGSPVNYMMFIGQNYLRSRVGADDRYQPTHKAQLLQMKELLRKAEAFSPVGLSCGFEYAPGVTTEETVELLSAFEREGHLLSAHFREDGAASAQSIQELVQISRESGCGVQMSHIGSCSAVGYMKEALDTLLEARKQGVDIMADCYPYTAFCTGIGTAVFDEGCFEKWGKDYSALLVTAGPYQNQRCTEELFYKLRKEDPGLSVVAFVMNEEEVELAYQAPFVMVGSDCGFNRGCGHPRGAGTYPRVLSRYVREKKALTLISALEKMTYLPAQRLGLSRKGQVREGFDADLVIFDAERIQDRADFFSPTEAPEGVGFVLVNGRVAVRGTEIADGTLGCYVPYMPGGTAR